MMLKHNIKKSIESNIKLEFEDFLKEKSVYRNWYRSIKAKTPVWLISIDIPRTRWNHKQWNVFCPDIKWTTISQMFDDIIIKILNLMRLWNTFSDIRYYFNEVYWFWLSNNLLSSIYNSIYDEIISWKNRTLNDFYLMLYLDATFIKLKVKDSYSWRYTIKSVPVYFAIWVNTDWEKEILDFIIADEPENSTQWQFFINNLSNRWVKDVLFACVDWLPWLKEAVISVFTNTEIQPCIVHKIRNVRKYISYKDHWEFMKDIKSVYNANSFEEAELKLTNMKSKWKKYNNILSDWFYNIDERWKYFNYNYRIRKLIYTTNIIENWNWLVKSNIWKRKVYFTHKSAEISIFLAITYKQWKLKKIYWINQLLLQLKNIFWDRIPSK